MKLIALAAVMVLLIGCHSGTLFTSTSSTAYEHYMAIEQSCPDDGQRAHCVDAKVRADQDLMQDPDADLLILGLAYAKAVEARVAAGTMTREDGDVAIAEIRSRAIQIGQARAQNRYLAAQQAYANALQGFALYSAASQPYTLQTTPSSSGMIICWQNGPWVVCQ